MKSKEQRDALRKAEIILKVRSGAMTATEGAQELGISRKTYYKWEKRGLEGMMEALLERPCGRPSEPTDGEKTNMRKEILGLEKALLKSEQRLHAREVFLTEDPEIMEIAEQAWRKKKEKDKRDSSPDGKDKNS